MTRDAFDLENAWAGLAEMIGWIVSAFGAPGEIAQRLGFLRRDRGRFLDWLAPLEALARRLLFIEAASLPAANAPAPFVAAGRIAPVFRDAPHAETLDAADAWRVAFQVGLPGPPAPDRRGADRGIAARFRRDPLLNAIPLARRLEALLRVARDRAGAVRRLARRLQAAPARAARAFPPCRSQPRIASEALAEAQAEIAARRAGLADTS